MLETRRVRPESFSGLVYPSLLVVKRWVLFNCYLHIDIEMRLVDKDIMIYSFYWSY